MGSIGRRLERLEDRDRETAAAEVRRAWDRLSDEEMALVLGPYRHGREPTAEESAAEERFRRAVPEALIARAIGYSEEMADTGVSRRLQELIAPVIERRRSTVPRLLTEAG